jgi:hypothetical protein
MLYSPFIKYVKAVVVFNNMLINNELDSSIASWGPVRPET